MQHELLNAETAVIGSILIDARSLDEIRETITPEDLQNETNRALFRAACALADAGELVDPVTIQAKTAEYCAVSAEYLIQLMDVTPTARNAGAYAKQLAEDAYRARLKEAAVHLLESCDALQPAQEIASAMQTELEAANERKISGGMVSGQQALFDFVNYRIRMEAGEVRAALPTGYPALDSMLGGGLFSEGLYILAARPGVGKTTMALNLAERVAKRGVMVLFISLEMSLEQLAAKRLAIVSGLPYGALMVEQNLSDRQTHTYIDTMAEIQNRPILFNRKPMASVSDVLFLARQAKGLGLIVIDYLGILRHEAGRSLYERVTATSGALKRMARAVHVPVLCLAQLNRETEGRTGGKPRLSDLRDSGAIEQDADGVLLLHSPVERDKLAHGEPLPLFLTAAKNRHGGTGEIGFDFHLQNSRIVQQRQSHMEEQP